MYVNNLYFAMKFIVTRIDELEGDFVNYHSECLEYTLIYLKKNYAIDVFTKKKMYFSEENLEVGEQFINIRQWELIPFTSIFDNIPQNEMIKIKRNMSRKELFKLIIQVNKYQREEIYQREKTKIKVKNGGKL